MTERVGLGNGRRAFTVLSFLRFSLVGFAFLILGALVLYGLVDLVGLPYLPAYALAFVALNFASYLANKTYSFRAGRRLRRVELMRYYLVALSGLAFGTGLMALLVGGFSLHYLPASILVGIISAGFNYAGHVLFTFPHSSQRQVREGLGATESLREESSVDSEFGETYLDYQLNKSWVRRLVRRIYIWRMQQRCVGPVIDLGCGPGAVLRYLPTGSVGLEVNQSAVKYASANGLDVQQIKTTSAETIGELVGRDCRSLLCAHVLEHLSDPVAEALAVMQSCEGIGVERIVFVVPGAAGFASDKTHRTFVQRHHFDVIERGQSSYSIIESSYFPGNFRRIGDWFKYHELMVVFARQNT